MFYLLILNFCCYNCKRKNIVLSLVIFCLEIKILFLLLNLLIIKKIVFCMLKKLKVKKFFDLYKLSYENLLLIMYNKKDLF